MDTTTNTTPTNSTTTSPTPSASTAPVATTPAPFPDDDPRAVFARSVALATAVIDAVPAERLDAPTPSGMDVRELLGHLVMVIRGVAWAGRGEGLDTWPKDAADVAEGGWGAAWRAGAHEVQDAWTDPAVLARQIDLPWGTFSGTEVLGVYTNEVTVHTWDLARGTGQQPAWDPTVLAVADAAIRSQLPLADRAPMWAEVTASLPPGVPWQAPFGPAVAVADDAPAIDRLVAWNGRRP
ncbi:MAG TPA: TIGR03086 family metal-binding protein [Acidimicrobiales bacterium]|jgi:uncharacterized protein (TIGR03086 family)|nr:TIGR03086 family metal-binding protein [Acidimicrobiales bacterium]